MKNIIYRIVIIVCIVAIIAVTYLVLDACFSKISLEERMDKEKPNLSKELDVYSNGNIVGKAYLLNENFQCFDEGNGITGCTEELKRPNETISDILYTKEAFAIKKGESLDIKLNDMKKNFENLKDNSKIATYDIFCNNGIVKQSGMRPVDVINIDISDLEVARTYYVELVFKGNNVICEYGLVFKII